MPDKVKLAIEQQRRYDKNPNGYKQTGPGERLRRTLLRWQIVADYSIMMLSMLAFSPSFRSIVEQGPEDMWALVWTKILENHESIEYFAKARGLQWKDLLKRYTDFELYIDVVQTLGERFTDEVRVEHPHTRVVPPLGGDLRVPTSDQVPKRPQIVIDHNIWDEELWSDTRYPRPTSWPGVWPYPFNPMTRISLPEYDENCKCCGSETDCACRIKDLKNYSDVLLELRDYKGKGVGVRTLQAIKSGTVLGEYLGEIVPNGSAYDQAWNFDNTYGWEVDITIPDGPRYNPLATIASHEKGNWCRFVNHSCDNSLSGDISIVGDRRCLLYWAVRDILPFEELTVDYGNHYFRPPEFPCRCGEDICRNPPHPGDQQGTGIDRGKAGERNAVVNNDEKEELNGDGDEDDIVLEEELEEEEEKEEGEGKDKEDGGGDQKRRRLQ